jgi:hypothetical protein
MEKLSNYSAKASVALQERQEKNIAKGLYWGNPVRAVENVTMAVARIGFFLPAAISKVCSLVTHGIGDFLINGAKMASKTAYRKWKEDSNNALICGGLCLVSGFIGVIGLGFRTAGVITGGVGEALSKPCKAANPEGSAASNRSKLGLGTGALIRNLDRKLYYTRNRLFTSEETAETSLYSSIAVKMNSQKIKEEADKAQMKEKSEFDKFIKDIGLDIKNPQFNQISGIKGDNKKYIKVAQVSYDNNDYKVLLSVEGNVIIAQSGISKSGIPVSLNRKLPGFFTEVLNVVAETRESEEKAGTSYLRGSKTAITLREFREKFGGISSSSSDGETSASINEGKVLRDYLSASAKKYITNNLQNVAGYSVKVDENDHIHIGEIGEELKEIAIGKAATNIALFNVVSKLSKGKNKKDVSPKSSSTDDKGSPGNSIYISPNSVFSLVDGELTPSRGDVRRDRSSRASSSRARSFQTQRKI